ncbi:hypothetical protein [Bradyrhizobium prioriisuperbiae]|uniref:hypothetical protein n=1 Tax=Bradyrhizobium prioriisuperbiae TaxID=2854389 RepID=UPI0028E8FB8D|nr:hypothetical protein [Bradyrhizobium prioritasuperba]
MTTTTRHQTAAQIFLVPAIIAVIIAFGLVSALLGDGIWDALSWLALLLPVVVIAYYWLRRTQPRR